MRGARRQGRKGEAGREWASGFVLGEWAGKVREGEEGVHAPALIYKHRNRSPNQGTITSGNTHMHLLCATHLLDEHRLQLDGPNVVATQQLQQQPCGRKDTQHRVTTPNTHTQTGYAAPS